MELNYAFLVDEANFKNGIKDTGILFRKEPEGSELPVAIYWVSNGIIDPARPKLYPGMVDKVPDLANDQTPDIYADCVQVPLNAFRPFDGNKINISSSQPVVDCNGKSILLQP